jgi:hypothetical protein
MYRISGEAVRFFVKEYFAEDKRMISDLLHRKWDYADTDTGV